MTENHKIIYFARKRPASPRRLTQRETGIEKDWHGDESKALATRYVFSNHRA